MALYKDKGRDMTACDGLPPRMPCTPKRSLLHMSRAGGMASPFGGGKVFSEGVNLSPRRGEEIATRLLYLYLSHFSRVQLCATP